MQPLNSSAVPSTFNPTSPKALGKRKSISAEQDSPGAGGEGHSSAFGQTAKFHSVQTVVVDQPTSKRLKISHASENIMRAQGTMGISKGKGISRPITIDLTKGPSSFQPHIGPKRLVIKNLKDNSALKDNKKYYEDTWDQLNTALTCILHRKPLAIPNDTLSRGVEAICRYGRSAQLSAHVKIRSEEYLHSQLRPLIESEAGTTAVGILRCVHRHWVEWIDKLTFLRSIFVFLDRSYHLRTRDCLTLEDQGIAQFRHEILKKGRIGLDIHGRRGARSISEWAVAGVCELVQFDRLGEDSKFDAVLLRDSVSLLRISGIYWKGFHGADDTSYGAFQPEFLRLSDGYFEEFAKERSTSAIDIYIKACEILIEKESLRCDAFNFDSTTKRSLLDQAYYNLIEQCSSILLSLDGVSKLIDADARGSLKALYRLLSLSKIQQNLRGPWECYIKNRGSAIVSDKERIKEMVVRLLELKKKLDLVIRDSFKKDESFSFKLREAFSNFINDNANTNALGKDSGNSKVGEMIAKYLDELLRGGVKVVPRSLISDAQDRAEAEKLGQASTGDEDAELDRSLEQGLELFRFIEGKDVFEAFYKKDLAKRLLMGRSASQDAERNMLAKLKSECGYSFTHNLEQMFKDQELAREEMALYKDSTGKQSMELQVSVLSSAAWPTYPEVDVKLPDEVAMHIEKYDRYYKHKHSGRKLTWKHSLAHSIVRAHFNKGTKELLVSAFQAIVLVLFNDIDSTGNLSYIDIAAATGLVDAELIRTLQSLACAQFRVLTKHPKGRDINPTDTFTVNLAFTNPKYRIKINQIQLKETKEEVEQTHERVYQDRQYETQAAIVRLMKTHKRLAHPNLVAMVIDQTKKRGMVEVAEIKKNIEKLIEKEYLEREGGEYIYLA